MIREHGPERQTIEVYKAIIVNENGDIFLVQRDSKDSWCPGYWETPGGKGESEEEAEIALIREVREETGVRVQIISEVHTEEFLMTEGHRRGNLYEAPRLKPWYLLSFTAKAVNIKSIHPRMNPWFSALADKVHSYICRIQEGAVALGSEHQDYVWLPLEEALGLNLTVPARNSLLVLKRSNPQSLA